MRPRRVAILSLVLFVVVTFVALAALYGSGQFKGSAWPPVPTPPPPLIGQPISPQQRTWYESVVEGRWYSVSGPTSKRIHCTFRSNHIGRCFGLTKGALFLVPYLRTGHFNWMIYGSHAIRLGSSTDGAICILHGPPVQTFLVLCSRRGQYSPMNGFFMLREGSAPSPPRDITETPTSTPTAVGSRPTASAAPTSSLRTVTPTPEPTPTATASTSGSASHGSLGIPIGSLLSVIIPVLGIALLLFVVIALARRTPPTNRRRR